jgi:type IX secretion system PorP/SprF family membrane protein
VALFASTLYAQQLPLTESYFVDRYSLSSAYAGNSENKSLFVNYRRDWSGVSAGPRTFRLSYHDELGLNAGLGGKIILDQIGIFKNFFAMGSYSYRLKTAEGQFLVFGLSAGIHQNWIDFSEYYNDPDFDSDPSMINRDVKSNMMFASDFSLFYSYKNQLQFGLLFSNISHSDTKYAEVKTTYNPLVHYQLHASYAIPVDGAWRITPLAIYRGGKNLDGQFEMAAQVKYNDRLWASLAHRGKNVFSAGFGLNISKGVLLNYNYNFFTGVSVSKFQNHELTIGLNFGELFPKKDDSLNKD